jgi:predicted component of type VI protein secretion system
VSNKLLVKDPQGEREVVLVDTVQVGRDPRCDISAADPLLSRRHAEFVASGPTVVVRDLQSRNGILVNGRRTPQAVLHPGDVVQIAHLVVTFVSHVEAETGLAPIPAPDEGGQSGSQAPGPGDDKTSLLNPAEIQAIAAASAAGRRRPADGSAGGTDAGNDTHSNASGVRRSGAWSVQLVAEDDRTNLVTPHLPLRAEASAGPAKPPLPPTLAGPLVDPLLPPPSLPAEVVQPAATRGPEPGRPAAPAGAVARTVALAILCFTFGVASTMIWLQPPLTARWLLLDHVPVAVAVAFVFVLVAGGLAGFAISRTVGRVESN